METSNSKNIKRIPKANYKIFDKRHSHYVSSGSSSKKTWNSTHWVYEKLKNITKYGEVDMSNFEIHIFPIETAIVKSAEDFITEIKAEEEAKINAKLILDNQRKKSYLINKANIIKQNMLSELEKIQKEIDLL